MSIYRSYPLNEVQIEKLKSVLDIAGQMLDDWRQDLNDGGDSNDEEFAKKKAIYVEICEVFGVTPWELE